MPLNLPILLTLLRLVLIPALVVVIFMPYAWARPAAGWIFLCASLTDFLDGFLARRLKLATRFGAFLDPVADKLLVMVALIVLVQAHPHLWLTIPALLIIGREIAISALREWMAEVGEGTRVAVSTIGKIKTWVQMTALTLMLYQAPLFGLPTFAIGVIFLYAATLLALWSMALYLKAAWPQLAGS